MSRAKFLSLLFISIFVFIFIKIYQHNQLIKLNYEKQRAQKNISELKGKKENLLVQLYTLKNQDKVKQFACQDLGMKPLKLSQIVTITEKNL